MSDTDNGQDPTKLAGPPAPTENEAPAEYFVRLADYEAQQREALRSELEKEWTNRNNDTIGRLLKECDDLRDQLKDARRQLPNFSVPGTEPDPKAKESFSMAKAAWAIRSNDWSKAGYERECFKATEQKAMSFGSPAAGGYIVPDEQSRELIDNLRTEAVVMQLGARMLNLVASPFKIPRKSGNGTAYWISEAGTITASDLTLQQVSMQHKKLAALVTLSNELLRLSDPGAEAVVREDIQLGLRLELDRAAMIGSGASGEPLGIINQSGVGTATFTAANPTWAQLIGPVANLAASNALTGKLGWAISPGALYTDIIGGTVGATNLDVTRRDMWNAIPQTLLGYPVRTTTALDADVSVTGSLIFGNWDDLLIGSWGGLMLEASPHVKFTTDQTDVRAVWLVDIAVRHAASFCVGG